MTFIQSKHKNNYKKLFQSLVSQNYSKTVKFHSKNYHLLNIFSRKHISLKQKFFFKNPKIFLFLFSPEEVSHPLKMWSITWMVAAFSKSYKNLFELIFQFSPGTSFTFDLSYKNISCCSSLMIYSDANQYFSVVS